MIWLWIFLSVAVLVMLVLYLAAEYFFRMAISRKGVKPSKRHKESDPWAPYRDLIAEGSSWIAAQNPERVTLQSFDGLKLAGFFLPCEHAVRTVLCMHGYRGSARGDFAPVARYYHEHGCNLLLVDERAHGDSEGKYICYGVKERFDCRDWARYLAQRLGEGHPIFLDGVSMGGATVLMASGLELPGSVRGIIADCGFTSPWDIFVSVMRGGFHLPVYPLLPLFAWLCRARAGFDPREASTLDAVRKTRIPIFFLHGARDHFVPTQMGRDNYQACASPKELLIIPEAGHALSYLLDSKQCQERIQAFLDRYTL
ncbi:MAG: alpha/beta hydrolase [Eubacteriales bacterium]|nr:alpha/beta hydrolase [Eubacteriales bacterium]